MKRTLSEKLFDTFNTCFLIVISLLVIFPVLHVIAGSFSSTTALMQGEVKLWPVGWNVDNYETVMRNGDFWHSFGITIIIVVVATTLNMVLTTLTAYPLSKTHLKGRRAVLLLILFTMIFQAPMIPTYLLIKELHMINTLWAVIIPFAISAFNLLIAMTFFRSLPEELFEAARVDGMSEFGILWRIVVPLSMPIMVTLLLFYSVGHWNSYLPALMYINDQDLRPLQLYLYNLIAKANVNETMANVSESAIDLSPQGLQMASIIVATVPIVLVYPFIQRHFIKGALIGSLKE